MKRHIILIAMVLSALMASASEEFTLKGSVRDRMTGSYIMMAKIECLNEQDSVIGEAWAVSHDYDYRRQVSVEKAIFWMDIPRVKGNYTLRFTHEDFDTITAPLNLTDIGAREYDREIGTFYMDRPKVKQLKEVEVTASKILFYNRGDTIVYNADAFQLAEGSMLDALIEQLPGVELREGGKIYVNGKFVQSLLLNGKDFFKGDNQLMLDNLAAYTVKNIEVYKKQTDRAKFLGLDDDANKEYVMDVKLKKEYIGGWTINSEMAGGTEDRYLARLFAMNFRALSQFTLLGNANNLNDYSRPTAEDQWDPENMTEGKMRYIETGLDYSAETDDGTRKASGNVIYTNQHILSEQTSNTTTFLPGQNTYGSSYNNYENTSQYITSTHDLKLQTSSVAIQLNPRISWRRGTGGNESESKTSLEETLNDLINSALSKAYSKGDSFNVGSDVSTTVKIPKTSDAVDIFGSFSFRTDNNEQESYSIIKYGDPNKPTDARRQLSDDKPTHQSRFSFGTKYNLVLNDKLNMGLRYDYQGERLKETSSFYLGKLDASYTGDYTLENLYDINMTFDPTNSNISDNDNDEHKITTSASWQPTKSWNLSARLPIVFTNERMTYRQDGIKYPAKVCYTHLDTDVSLEYSTYKEDGGNFSLDFGYNRYSQSPMLENMITIPNTRDPLSQYLGNPELRPAYNNTYSFMIQKSTRSNFSAYAYAYLSTTTDAISQSYNYDISTGKRTFKTINVDGNWNLHSNAYASWYWSKYNWNFSMLLGYSHTCSHSMTGTNGNELQLVTMHTNNFNPRLTVHKYFGGGRNKYLSLTIWPNFTKNTSTDITANNLSPRTGYYKLAGKYELPYGWSISTSLVLRTRHGYNDPEMDRDEWIWNGRITKTLMKGKLMASFIAYDLLHQHQAYNYRLTPQMRIETFTNTIPRYMLLDLQYKINIQPKKKIAQTTHYW